LASEQVERRLAAVLAADVAGYSRLMGIDEEGTLARLKAVRKALVDPAIASHRGRIVKATGDGILIEFVSAVDASLIAADANKQRSIPGSEWIKERDPETVSRAVKEYMATLDDAAFGGRDDVSSFVQDIASTSDRCRMS
jgi:hypothetical protein